MLTSANQEWALDFVCDAVASGRGIRMLTVVDSYTRECPAIEVGVSIGSRRVTRVLERMIAERGAPKALRCDNGPEFTSRHFLSWCEQRGITLVHIEPGRPMQNGYVESFNGHFRDECLNANWFVSIVNAKEEIERWRMEYNGERPHSSLDYRTPEEFAKTCSELTSRMAAIPPDRPSTPRDRTAVLAGKGSLRRAKPARPCPLRAAVQLRVSRRAAPAGWLRDPVEWGSFQITIGREKRGRSVWSSSPRLPGNSGGSGSIMASALERFPRTCRTFESCNQDD